MNALLIAFPYIETALLAALFAAIQAEKPIFPIVCIGIVAAAALIAALIAAIRNAAKGLSAEMNLRIKLIQIPIYVFNFALAILGFLMGVFGMVPLLWAASLDAFTILLTGISAVGCTRKLFREARISGKQVVWMTIGGFVYCADVVVAILLRHKEKQ